MPEWAAISAIAGLIGVIWAIYAYIYKRRKNISIELATDGRHSNEPKIHIIITNDSERQLTIVRILTREKEKDLIELSTQDFDLPKTIQCQNHIRFNSLYLAYNIEKISEIYAEDTAGKKWKVGKKSLRQAKKILGNYIGKRLIFTSMGDVVDENKIK